MFNVLQERSIAKLNLISLLVIIALLSLAMGFLFISGYNDVFKDELKKVEKDYVFLRKERIINLVNLKVGDIENQQSRAKDILKEKLNKQVFSAHNVSSIIYHTYKKTKSESEVRELIKKAIQSIRHSKGEGLYLFCADRRKILLCPDPEVFNSLSFIDYPNLKGEEMVRKFTRRAKTIGETYLEFEDPSASGYGGGIFFLKRFDVFNWFIGSLGRYRTIEATLKRRVLRAIKRDSIHEDGVHSFEVYELNEELKGKQSLKVLFHPDNPSLEGQELNIFYQDAKGTRYINKLIKEIKQNNSAHIEYWDIDKENGPPRLKLTYYKLYPKWNWIIAKGFYIESSDMLHMQRMMKDLERNLEDKIKSAAGLFLFFIVVSIIISVIFSKAIARIFNTYKKEVEDRSIELADTNTQLNSEITERMRMEVSLRKSEKQLRRLASEVQLSEEKERRRIAGDLHDSIGASLAISNLKLELLSGKLETPEYLTDLKVVHDNIKQAIQQTRSLTFQLSPPVLYQMGLEAALAGLAEQTEKLHGIETTFFDDMHEKYLEEDVRIHIFRSARELLVNVIKHANANKVSISVSRIDHQIVITIADNGDGFEINGQAISPEEGGKFGLFSIRERLKLLGGVLEIDSVPGRGSTMKMRAPLKESEKQVEETE